MRRLDHRLLPTLAKTVEVTDADRKRMRVNERRVAEGLEPLEAEPVPDELEFYEKARRLGLLRRAGQPAR
ncbi:MAG: hypothetical protein DYH08_04000 [Actinobacteria bacterium ATB1]|nr:hypothetical protein [Actinobacteria bacterium ATB1]